MIIEEEKLKIPTREEMREIIIEIKKDTKQMIKKIKEEEEKNNEENQENQENQCLSFLYDPCVIKFLCLVLFVALFVIIIEVINNNRKAY